MHCPQVVRIVSFMGANTTTTRSLAKYAYRWVAVEDVVIAFARRAGPNVRQGETQLLHVVEIAEKNLVVDRRSEMPRPEEVNGVEIGDVNATRVGHGGVRAVLLNVHTEEANVDAVNLFEGEKCPRSIRKRFTHFASVNEPKDYQVDTWFGV